MSEPSIDSNSHVYLREIRNIARRRQALSASTEDIFSTTNDDGQSLTKSTAANTDPKTDVSEGFSTPDDPPRAALPRKRLRSTQSIRNSLSLTPTSQLNSEQHPTDANVTRRSSLVSKIPLPTYKNQLYASTETVSTQRSDLSTKEDSNYRSLTNGKNQIEPSSLATSEQSIFGSSHRILPALGTAGDLSYSVRNSDSYTDSSQRPTAYCQRRSRLPQLVRPSAPAVRTANKNQFAAAVERSNVEQSTYQSSVPAASNENKLNTWSTADGGNTSSSSFDRLHNNRGRRGSISIGNSSLHQELSNRSVDLPRSIGEFQQNRQAIVSPDDYQSTQMDIRSMQTGSAYKSALRKPSASANRKRKSVHFLPNLELVRVVSKIEYPWYRQSRLPMTNWKDRFYANYASGHHSE